MSATVARRHFTVEDYHALARSGILAEDDRVELLNGEVVKMSPIGSPHAACVDRLNRSLMRSVGVKAIVRIQNPIRVDDHSEPEPDVALVRPRADDYSTSHPAPQEVFLLIEVSDTSIAVDRQVKLPLYARAGIAEVWLVDLAARCVEVYSQPAADGYQSIKKFYSPAKLSPQLLPEVTAALAEILR